MHSNALFVSNVLLCGVLMHVMSGPLNANAYSYAYACGELLCSLTSLRVESSIIMKNLIPLLDIHCPELRDSLFWQGIDVEHIVMMWTRSFFAEHLVVDDCAQLWDVILEAQSMRERSIVLASICAALLLAQRRTLMSGSFSTTMKTLCSDSAYCIDQHELMHNVYAFIATFKGVAVRSRWLRERDSAASSSSSSSASSTSTATSSSAQSDAVGIGQWIREKAETWTPHCNDLMTTLSTRVQRSLADGEAVAREIAMLTRENSAAVYSDLMRSIGQLAE